MDVHSPAKRSYNMSKIHGKNTKPEILVRKYLWSQGFRYRLHKKKLPGKPDIVLSKYKIAIFVNGCFWHYHQCHFSKLPITRHQFWKDKLESNAKRDRKNILELKQMGWCVITVWECEIRNKKNREARLLMLKNEIIRHLK